MLNSPARIYMFSKNLIESFFVTQSTHATHAATHAATHNTCCNIPTQILVLVQSLQPPVIPNFTAIDAYKFVVVVFAVLVVFDVKPLLHANCLITGCIFVMKI